MFDQVHVDISDVATWFYEKSPRDYYVWAVDFPAVVSPWPLAVYRWQMPRFINRDGDRLPSPLAGTLCEVIVLQAEIEHDAFSSGALIDELPDALYRLTGKRLKLPGGAVSNFQSTFVSYAAERELTCRWMQVIVFRSESTIVGGGLWMQFLDTDGHFIGGEELGPILVSGTGILTDENASTVLYPLAFSLALLNCRNVEVRDRPISRQQRRMAERTGKPTIVYKELVIDAFRKQVRYETQREGGDEVKRALHICRGHFATYTDDNPLFGKYTGTFWRPMHKRGHKEAGEVRKSYKITKGEE